MSSLDTRRYDDDRPALRATLGEVADEATFLQLLAAHPADLDTRLVYADWLEGQGQLPRARVLRMYRDLATTPFRDRSFVRKARALLASSRGVDGTWLAAISHPRLDGTCWGTRDHQSVPYLIGFLPAGQLIYRRGSDQTGGSWGQVGNAVRFDINGYSEHVGGLADDRLRGTARNGNHGTWNWELVPLDPRFLDGDFPELDSEPMDTNYRTGSGRDTDD